MTRTRARLLLALAAIGGLLSGCGDSDGNAAHDTTNQLSGDLVVFAASSLTDAFTEIGAAFHDANPEVTVTYSFAGSGDLVTQIIDGAPVDVFASADATSMGKLTADVTTDGDPTLVAHNTFSIIVERGNPEGISDLADLADPELVVVLCADTVPCGRGAASVLANAGVTLTPKSYEDKVKGVVTKVTAGEADAGIVFASDVVAAGASATSVSIAADVNVLTDTLVAALAQSAHPAAAKAFATFVASPAGQAILAKYGFLAP